MSRPKKPKKIQNLRLFRAYYALPSPHPAYQLLWDALMRFLEDRY